MVKLTEYEQKMLDGEMGEFKQVAIRNIIKYAEALGAEELCEVNKATLFFGAHNYLEVVDSDDYNEIFSKMYMCSDKTMPLGKFADCCYCQTCATPGDYFTYESTNISKESFLKNRSYLEKTKDAGAVITGACTPYLMGWIPMRGEHYVTTESSNVIMCNAVFGACGNSDGIEAAVWSAVCGRTPLWGNHVMENRKGTHIFNIKIPSHTSQDWDIIGYEIGKRLPPHAIPIISGDFERPNLVKLKQCFSAMATTSGAEMCHIVGVTPEARTVEDALGGKEPQAVIDITMDDYNDALRCLCDEGSAKLDMVSIGCPHYAIEELQRVANYLRGKKVNKDVRLYVWTDISSKGVADVNGYTKIIEDSGAYLLTSGCPLNAGKPCHGNVKAMAFDAAKQAHYIKSETTAKVFYGTTEQCIDAAIKGVWEA